MPKVGAHVSAALSLDLAFERAKKIDAECFQIFVSPPRQWSKLSHDANEIERFKRLSIETKIGPNFIHGTYLVNLGSPNKDHVAKSIDWLIYALIMANTLDMLGVIIHTGSHKGEGIDTVLDTVVSAIKEVTNGVGKESKALLILETAASSNSIGHSFSDLGKIIKQVGDSRVAVCLDLQHSFAAGYDIKTPLGLKDVLEEFESEIGLAKLAAIHANDSKFDFKSHRDRHENIGEGFLGEEGFINIINSPSLKNVPFILEVPGIEKTGPDKENVAKLKSLIQ